MKGLFIVAAFAVVGVSLAACANHCSGNGKCIADDKCSCFNRYTGADCSQRKCKENYAWSDGAVGNAHDYAECSNKGVCDRATGECMCYPGYEGAACQRSECPNSCSGHGTCESLNTLSGGYSGTFWDLNKIQGCKCDAWWTGYDCSQRQCPRGDDPLTACPAPSAGPGQCNGQVWTVKYEQFSDARYTKRTAVAKKNVHWLVQDLYGEWYASRSFLVGDPSVPSTVTTNDLSNNQNTEARAALEDMDWWVSFATTDPFEFVDDTDDALEQATAVTFTMRLKSPKRINTIRLIKDDCDEAGCYPLQPTGQTDTDYTLTSSFIGDHPSAAAQVTELLFAEDLSVTTADFQSKYIEITNAAGVQMAVWFDPLATTAATTLGQPLGIQASTSSLREFVTITVAANTNFNDGSAGDEKYIEVTDHTGREFAVWTDYNTDGTQPAAITAETADIASVAPTATTTTTIATDIKTAFTGISGFTDVFHVYQAGAVLQFTSKYPGFDVTDSVTDFAGGDLTAANTDGDTVNGDAAQVIDSSVVPLGSSAATVATQVQTKLAAANTAITGAVTVVEVATDNIVRITNDASGAADYVYTDLPTSVVTVSRTTTGATAEVDESTGTASVYTLTCGAAAAAGNWHNKYVEVSTLDGREFAVWVDVDGDGDWQDMPTAIKAAPSDIAIVTSVSDTDTGSTVATAVNTAFGTLTGFGDHFTTSVSSAVITFTYRGAGDPTAPATNDGTAAVWAETTTGVAKTATSAGAEDLYTVAESDICSNRGICDHDSGKCQCFEGHTGVACEDQTILV